VTDTLPKNGGKNGGGNGGGAEPLDVTLLAADPPPVQSNPIVLNDGYFEMQGINLRCMVKHLEIAPENKLVTQTSFCNETDWPGVTKWHLRADLYQSFDPGSVYDTLAAALANYQTSSVAVPFKARPYASRPISSSNRVIAGFAVPQPFTILSGDAGALAEVSIDWNLTAPPTVTTGGIAATGATAGAPGFFTPSGSDTPANLAALTAGPVVASPATSWAAGQFVITADLLAAYWNGTAWTAGKHP
jgi:hypothetical protein